jgi:hypothetical protein
MHNRPIAHLDAEPERAGGLSRTVRSLIFGLAPPSATPAPRAQAPDPTRPMVMLPSRGDVASDHSTTGLRAALERQLVREGRAPAIRAGDARESLALHDGDDARTRLAKIMARHLIGQVGAGRAAPAIEYARACAEGRPFVRASNYAAGTPARLSE